MTTIQQHTRSLRVLVVEDHEDTMYCLRRRIEKAGHVVLEAGTVNKALEVISSSPLDVLLSDVGLPDGTGWDLLRDAAALFQKPVYAAAMSGYGDVADREKSKRAGFSQHLVKPLQKSDVEQILATACQHLEGLRLGSGNDAFLASGEY